MYYNGHKFHIKKVDETKRTCDSRLTRVFEVTDISSRNDMYHHQYENRYYGILDDIIGCHFNSFKQVIFDVKWYKLILNQNDPNRIFIEHNIGFIMISTRPFELVGNEPYVLPRQCEQVFYFGIPH